jgi:sterol desaturase/sphingolipid hydroxylase (fatty acid hydroxylase superfamily)
MLDPILLTILTAFAVVALLERTGSGRRFPKLGVAWPLRGLAFLALTIVLSSRVPLLWDEWLSAHQLFDARSLGTWGGAAVGFVVFEGLLYGWHRALHSVPWLWRFHQMHHSAERVDIFGSNFFHPIDVAGFALVTSVALVLVVGVSAEAAGITGLAAVAANFFQHANIRTPRWLGFLVQRPESHSVHHERGLHADNYSDLPGFDMLFGTFRNPDRWQGEAGFWDGASAQLGDLLLGRDVTREDLVSGQALVAAPMQAGRTIARSPTRP